ncbi:Na+/H+ antiporter NhaC family protein [Rubritalea tangerina]|uniref:Na+/H+ antiporter NhaC family protein n=1 Tax=Rubritalea tangerina TaxID=430798 RepID=UPI0036172EBA
MILPAVVALVMIVVTRQAALSLLSALIVGVMLQHKGDVMGGGKALVVDYLFPALSGSWHIGPILFTLILGAFAQVLERSGGFVSVMQWLIGEREGGARRKTLLGVYGMGLICFFDGLANAILVGSVARPFTEGMRVSRQLLAYLIDSTSSAVACIAFISTWIATQLSLINDGVAGVSMGLSSAELYFRSIPANPYCWLVLVLLFVVIWRSWWIGPMRRYQGVAEGEEFERGEELEGAAAWRVVVPLLSILVTIPGVIYMWQDGGERSWQNAFSSTHVPEAMVAGALVSLVVACVCFPKKGILGRVMLEGAASLLPALVILIFAWSLGAVFKDLEVAVILSGMLGGSVPVVWLPLVVFLVGSLTSFLTGSSWGTMGILMPIVLPLGVEMLGADGDFIRVVPMLIGAVFGGAVFGDNCSPFSDTTIVTSLATGCSPSSHVSSQLPYALLAAGGATVSYGVMALGAAAWVATLIGAVLLVVVSMVWGSRGQESGV